MTETVLDYMTRLGRAAREASRQLARASTAQKNHALLAAAEALMPSAKRCCRPINWICRLAGKTGWMRRCWIAWR